MRRACDLDERWRTLSTYRERRGARADRLRDWADGRDVKADAAFGRAEQIAGMIPFGQPILVGHHSEGRARRDQDRIHSGMSRGVEHGRKADEMRRKAANIDAAADRAIYSDDPDALERLGEKLAGLEAKRDRIKRYNATARKGAPDESILSGHERSELAGLKKIGSVFVGTGGSFPKYVLANLSGTIKTTRDRLASLEAKAAE